MVHFEKALPHSLLEVSTSYSSYIDLVSLREELAFRTVALPAPRTFPRVLGFEDCAGGLGA